MIISIEDVKDIAKFLSQELSEEMAKDVLKTFNEEGVDDIWTVVVEDLIYRFKQDE